MRRNRSFVTDYGSILTHPNCFTNSGGFSMRTERTFRAREIHGSLPCAAGMKLNDPNRSRTNCSSPNLSGDSRDKLGEEQFVRLRFGSFNFMPAAHGKDPCISRARKVLSVLIEKPPEFVKQFG